METIDIDMGLMRGTLDVFILDALTWGPRHGYGVVDWIEQATAGRRSKSAKARATPPVQARAP